MAKPNPSKDRDGKPRVLYVAVSDPASQIILALRNALILKDSRAAERDIVKVTAGTPRIVRNYFHAESVQYAAL